MSRVMGFVQLAAQAAAVVRESGSGGPFDADAWTTTWLSRNHPALGGRPPSELMGSSAGRARIHDLLAQQQSGAYA
jgi:uncharacterized protein (DUF2384 family)